MPYLECNGAELYYETNGSGPPIVLLHGVMGSCRFFEPQLSGLSDQFQVTGLDYRGHGRSEKTEMGHTVAGYARDLEAFLDQRGLEDVVLVGWSLGAFVSWEYVDQFGTERLRALVDVDMEATRFQWDDYEYGIIDLEGLAEIMALVQTDRSSLIERISKQVYKEPPDADRWVLQVDELSRVPAPIKSAILFDATMSDYREILPEIDVPTLVCAGTDEKRGTVASVKAVADRIPDATFERFEDSGHCPHLEEPVRFNRVLRAFVHGL
ncbi:alpha/beta hydrolase [Halobacteria archaeon AArc-curdl1]|uniref:Alpha/beta hydrolase n=1 Tax=Natronosalvus hydrolyticus TaxID=2979988 RepID=A0AAP3E6Q5_9EURY|nr:alpha/beta hydrolase [Halobacteria archaeon AArc-curdl1]